MGVDLTCVTMAELWLLVAKRCVYLVAKFISFKGAAFLVSSLFLMHGIISGAVWCSLILGIITNRTGKQIMSSIGKGDAIEEPTKTQSGADAVGLAGRPAGCASSCSTDAIRRDTARKNACTRAKEQIRDILSGKL